MPNLWVWLVRGLSKDVVVEGRFGFGCPSRANVEGFRVVDKTIYGVRCRVGGTQSS